MPSSPSKEGALAKPSATEQSGGTSSSADVAASTADAATATSSPASASAAASSVAAPIEPPAGVEEIMRAAQARRESKPAPADRPQRISPGRVWSEPVSIEDGGRPQTYVLALDELMVRGEDGKDRLAAVSASSPDELQTMIDAMSASIGETVAAVLYPEGVERNDYTRRLLSPLITVKLAAEADVAAIASQVGVVDYELPDYAPGFAVLRTPGGLETFDVAEALRGIDGVEFAEVQLASLPQKKAMPNDTLINQQWHLKFNNQSGAVTGTDINVENVWAYPEEGAGHRGRGIRIGIVDDGLQTAHPDLAANVDTTNDKDWNGNDNDPNPVFTNDNHGTAVAGDAAAVGNNTLGVSGSAPEATLVGMRLIAAATTDQQEAEAMNYLPQVIQILNNSWGPNDNGVVLQAPGSLTRAALQNAATTGRDGRGTISMWAGGNGLAKGDDSNADGYANSIYTIAVAAFNSQSRQSWYSEPGANIVITSPSSGSSPALGKTTTDRTGSLGYNTAASPGGDYASDFGGTSSATPTAAGVVALMLEANPNLGWRDVQEILMRSAKKVNPTDPDWKTPVAPDNINHSHKFGGGLIDAQAAVTLAQSWTNLGAQTSRTASTTGLPVSIPDNDPTGVSCTFTVSDDLRVEHVTVTVSATHPRRGDLVFVLTSPSGTRSTLIDRPNDTGANYSNWTFSSVRHWGERSAGPWTLTVSDLRSGNTGSLTAASLTVFGVGEPASIVVTPEEEIEFSGPSGGPFAPALASYAISNPTPQPVEVTVSADVSWLVPGFSDGVAGGGGQIGLDVSVDAAAAPTRPGEYLGRIRIIEAATGASVLRVVRLRVNSTGFDFLTQEFTGAAPFNLANKSVTFTPDGSPGFYRATLRGAVSLPVDSAGGTVLSLGDDSFAEVPAPTGGSFTFFGVPYTQVFIGSNGYLTFSSGDEEYRPSLSSHFDRPRLSALYVDLNPAARGTVSWRQLPDRLAVTYDNVRQWRTDDSNTFQVEVFLDGRIRITWLRVDADTPIVGLSPGTGFDSAFEGSVFSGYPSTEGLPLAFEDFVRNYGLDPLGNGGLSVDADGDGSSNWLEFAFGTSPVAADGALVETSTSGEGVTFEFLRRQTDVIYEVLHTANLAAAFSTASGLELSVSSDRAGIPDGWEKVSFTVPATGAGFYRIGASPN